MANETWKFVQTKSKHAMKQVLGIKNEAARMKVTPPLAVAPHVHGDDMRWNPNDDGINFNPLRALRARAPLQAPPRNTPQESTINSGEKQSCVQHKICIKDVSTLALGAPPLVHVRGCRAYPRTPPARNSRSPAVQRTSASTPRSGVARRAA